MNIEIHIECKSQLMILHGISEQSARQTISAYLGSIGVYANYLSVEFPVEGDTASTFTAYEDSKEIEVQIIYCE